MPSTDHINPQARDPEPLSSAVTGYCEPALSDPTRKPSSDQIAGHSTAPQVELGLKGNVSTRSAQKKLTLERNKLHKKLRRETGKAIADFNMIADGDKIMVCISGGKDSLAMLDILMSIRDHAPVNFEILAVNLDQKQPGFPEHVLPAYFESLNVDYKILEEDTYSLVTEMVPEGKPIVDGVRDFAAESFTSTHGTMATTKLHLVITAMT